MISGRGARKLATPEVNPTCITIGNLFWRAENAEHNRVLAIFLVTGVSLLLAAVLSWLCLAGVLRGMVAADDLQSNSDT